MTAGDTPSHEERYAEALRQVTERLEGRRSAEGAPYPRLRTDVRALRERHGLTQQAFADRFGIALGTLRNWEQGRREPDGPAALLLAIIEQRPEVAAEVLGRPAPSAAFAPAYPVAAAVGTVVGVTLEGATVTRRWTAFSGGFGAGPGDEDDGAPPVLHAPP